MIRKVKVLQVTAVDTTVKLLLLPLIHRLIEEGYEVHSACSPGEQDLEEQGYRVHRIEIARQISPLSNLRSLWHLYRLMRQEGFQVVHVHTPVAAALGRIAAKLAGVPVIIYTAHGFYFHEDMRPWVRRVVIWIERFLGRHFTDWIFTQSREDFDTALAERMVCNQHVSWIGNGTDPQRFSNITGSTDLKCLKCSLGFGENDRIVGFIGRLVQEKGIGELLLAMRAVVQEIPEAKLLVVGDTLSTDRDRRAKKEIQRLLDENDLANVVRFTGHREDVPQLLALMDVFVLPSHREGMPRSIIEAMAAGKPVVATNIRGCREEVIHGVTGFLVPLRNPSALANAILQILRNLELARKMGEAGRQRAITEFDERFVLERQIQIYRKLIAACPCFRS